MKSQFADITLQLEGRQAGRGPSLVEPGLDTKTSVLSQSMFSVTDEFG